MAVIREASLRAVQADISGAGHAGEQDEQNADPDCKSNADLEIAPGTHDLFLPICTTSDCRVSTRGTSQSKFKTLRRSYHAFAI
jgi:hypothetical protein